MDISEPNKHGESNSPNMLVIIEHGITGHTFLMLPQEDGPNDIIGYTFLLLPQEYFYKLWVYVVTIIGEHETKVTQYPGHMKIICPVNDYQYE